MGKFRDIRSEGLACPKPFVRLLAAAVLLMMFWFLVSFGLRSGPSDIAYGLKCDADPKARPSEFSNTLARYKHFGEKCNVSSLDIHRPFDPVCPDRVSMLTAMSSGGRIGRDSPYVPRGCDLQWFTTEEVCEILGRFSQVILVGDSMLRHVIGAINIIVRENLGYGGVTDWNFDVREKYGNRLHMTT
jgi:hypothetical protein